MKRRVPKRKFPRARPKWKRAEPYNPVGFILITWLAFIMAIVSLMRGN